ncbi:MAG: caspase family protein [Planctomycetota bacterium]
MLPCAQASANPLSSGGLQETTYTLQFKGAERPGQGIEITEVTADGPLTKLRYTSAPSLGDQSISAGDLIVEIDRVGIRNLATFRRQMAALGDNDGSGEILVKRRDGYYWRYNVNAVPVAPPTPPAQDDDDEDEENLPTVRTVTDNDSARRVHFLICGQSGTTRKHFNDSITTSIDNMNGLIEAQVHDHFIGSTTVIRECTAAKIRDALRDLSVGPDDTIFFYYTGHGQCDRNNQHVFSLRQTGGYDVMRNEVETALKGKSARLTVMITDSCNVYLTDPYPMRMMMQYSVDARTEERTEFTGFERLLLNFSGVVSLNSADVDQRGWGNRSEGGIYTSALISGLKNPIETTQTETAATALTASEVSPWRLTLNAIAAAANSDFQTRRRTAMHGDNCPDNLKKQTVMTPIEFQFSIAEDLYNFTFPTAGRQRYQK